MTNNLFLHLCQQAENNQSYTLAKYLTWRSHQRDTGYTATLWDDDQDGLTLFVYRNNTDEEYYFDLSEIGRKMDEEFERKVEEEDRKCQARNAEEWFSKPHTVKEAAGILCTRRDELWDWYGDDTSEILDQAYAIAESGIDGYWDDHDPDYPDNCVSSGVIIAGERYRTHYSGVAGEFWQENGGPTWLPW